MTRRIPRGASAGRSRRSGPRDPGTFVVSGKRAVLEAIAAGRAREVTVARGARSVVAEVTATAESAGVPLRVADPAASDVRMPAGESVSARVELPAELSESDLARREYAEDAIVIVLDGITDPQNLGAAARSAEAAGAELLVTRRHRAAPITAAAVRASAGALVHIPLARVANIPRSLGRLQELDFWVVGLDGGAETTIYDGLPPEGRIALVLGDEGHGLSRLARERCDELRSMPMRGRVASLNASAALSAALFGFVLRSRAGHPGS